jgi:hypothetical protein
MTLLSDMHDQLHRPTPAQQIYSRLAETEARARAAFDQRLPAARAALAKLEVPWSFSAVLEPTSPFAPYRAVLSRHGGVERKVIVLPRAQNDADARRMAHDICDAEQAAYDEQVLDILWQTGVAEPHNALEGVKAERARLAEDAIPTGRVIPREEWAAKDKPAPANWWQAEGRGGTEGARVLGRPPEEKPKRIIRVGEEQCADASGKW